MPTRRRQKQRRRLFRFAPPSAPPPDVSRFDEAVDFFRARVPMPKGQWSRLGTAARQRAFTVAGVAQLDVLNDVWLALDDAIARGATFDEFKKTVAATLEREWQGTVKNPPARLETIYRTNILQANNAGRHAQMTDPVILNRRPYWQYIDIDDHRECPICSACHGVILRHDDPWWQTHTPPQHFNATPRETLIITERGEMPIGDVPVGIRVLTHRGRWQRVTATLHKIVRSGKVRALHLASGRCLRVTDDHPVLVGASVERGIAWKRAGDLEIGDVLFEHGDQVAGPESARIGNPQDAPSFADEPLITDKIALATLRTPMVFAVHFDGYTRILERKVENVGADGVLRDGIGQEGTEVAFLWGHLLAETAGPSGGDALLDAGHGGRIVASHALPVALMNIGRVGSQSECPMALAARDVLRRVGIRDAHLIETRAHGHSEATTPNGKHAVPDAMRPFNGSDAAPLLKMLDGDQCGHNFSVPVIDWHATTVINIADEVKNGELCDLSVEEDESYVAAGVIVHNCRCRTRPLTEAQAQAMGVSVPPSVQAQDGFGAPPQSVAPPWQPDLSKYPPELAAMAREKLEQP